MHEIFPKVNEVFSYHLKNFQVINGLMAAVSLRVEAEEQYERSISKSVQKISQIQTDHPLYSKIIKSFKSLVSERAHQVKFFKQQIAKEAQQLKAALGPIEGEMKAQLAQLKTMEKDLRINFDALMKNKTGVQQRFRELDQKFILNEVSALYKMNKGLRKVSESICNEGRELMGGLDRDWERLRVGVNYFEAGAQQRERKIWGLDIRVEEEFVDFFKKFNVHQISLIRNIQYDIDNMLKKTDIFNWQNTNQFKDRFNLRFTELFQFSQSDHYADFKQSILKDEQIISLRVNNTFDQAKYAQITAKLGDKKQAEQFLAQLSKNYPHYKREVYEFIESFRKSNRFKFEVDNFKLIVYIFREILKVAINQVDFDCIQKIILYSNSYYCPNYNNSKKRTILDQIRGEKTLADLTFWKFYLLYSIRQSVANCLGQKEERQTHIRNGVYSTLLSHSLSMVECGIEKHNIKNLVGKLAKTFGSLTESQVAELLKVIETGYENMEKVKKSKKE